MPAGVSAAAVPEAGDMPNEDLVSRQEGDRISPRRCDLWFGSPCVLVTTPTFACCWWK